MRGKINITLIIILVTGLLLTGISIYYRRNRQALSFVKKMGAGTNLGNSLDATGLRAYEPDAGDLEYETYWGNPAIDEEVFAAIYDAGFRTVRIPVTWEEHMDAEGNISAAWMNRVAEVIDMAFNEKLYVIVDMHHEEWLNLEMKNEKIITDRFCKVWGQIAERFRDYDEHLIFESMNEPRLRNSEYEWGKGIPELRDMVNRLNNSFVETVRGSGGNNSKRYLMITPYASSYESEAMSALTIPDHKIIVSIHAYIPYDFCQNIEGTTKWNAEGADTKAKISEAFERMDELFVSKGIPVIITEFGCKDKDNIKERIAWTAYFTETAKAKKIPYIWWDCNDYKLMNRENKLWIYPELVKILTGQ